MKDSYSEIFESKQRVMLVMAHPDDTEIFAGGLISRLVSDGKLVRVVKMTSGNKGSRQNVISETELSKTRLTEDETAMQILGVKSEDDICLDVGDGQVENDLATIGKVALQIRIFKPDLLVTHNPEPSIIRFAPGENWVNHRDHRHTGQTALDASYPYSRDILFFPEQFADKNVGSHVVKEFLFCDSYDHPDVVGIDISAQYATKVKAVSAHASQFDHEKAKSLIEFMNHTPEGTYFERFRHVVAD